MADNIFLHEFVSITKLNEPSKKLAEILASDKGARIGESTVASKKVHTYDPARPEEIQILQDIDAGQVFYQRDIAGEVCHLDIFHEQGLIDHRQIAKAVKEAVTKYNVSYVIDNCLIFNSKIEEVKPDLIDIQTGTGGGRITGSLNYGRKLSLRRAHENHVHVAATIPYDHMACLFLIVIAIEEIIQSCHLEIRKNERIVHQKGAGKRPGDMSAYSDHSDSFLRNRQSMRQQSQPVQKYQYNQDATELMNDFDTVDDLADTLKKAQEESNRADIMKDLEQKANGEKTLDRLTAMGILKCGKNKVELTKYGQELVNYVSLNMPEVQAHFRQALRLVKPLTTKSGRQKVPFNAYHVSGSHFIWLKPDNSERLGEFDATATVLTAAQRTISAQETDFFIAAADIRQNAKRKRKKVEICLLLDASASMAGQRIKALKFLARHLLLSSPDRISVIVFQEQCARILVPFTRDYMQVEDSLKELRAYGSTPLALGLRSCITNIREASAKNPLIVLITDGVATHSEHTRDPAADALDAAAEIKKHGCDFTCIGLKPHKNYLVKLADKAGGSHYIVDELDKQVLVKAVWSEYAERC